ncbi:MAG: hypothetical protein OHK0046_41770 [Anaerolineae bacterium]
MVTSWVATENDYRVEAFDAPYYATGRVLTAADLQQDREALLMRLLAAGQGIGHGIAHGLWVTRENATLKVQAGLGFNRQGEAVYMPNDFSMTLPPPASTTTEETVSKALFHVCVPGSVTGNNTGSLAEGVYLLVARPLTRQSEDTELVTRLSPVGIRQRCENLSEEAVIQFRLIHLSDLIANMGGMTQVETTTLYRKRNEAAHWAYGSDTLRRWFFNAPNAGNADWGYSGLAHDSVREVFTDCDLPLAMLYWRTTTKQILFVDNWSVRRRLVRHSVLQEAGEVSRDRLYMRGALFSSDQLTAEGEARFFQFQESLAGIESNSHARDYFRYLPPAGYLNVGFTANLIRSIGHCIIDLLLEAAAAWYANLPDDSSSLSVRRLLSENPENHVNFAQANGVIQQINSIIQQFAAAMGRLASAYAILLSPVLGLNALDGSGTTHIDISSSSALIPQVNEALTTLFTNLNRLRAGRQLTALTFQSLPILTPTTDENENNTHIEVALMNERIEALNIALEYLSHGLTEISQHALNPRSLFGTHRTSIRDHVWQQLRGFDAWTRAFASGSAIDPKHFFGGSPLRLSFMDRQAIKDHLTASWQMPAIDLQDTPPAIDILMPYEDIVPRAAAALMELLDNNVLNCTGYPVQYCDALQNSWYYGEIRSIFAKIAALENTETRQNNNLPPLANVDAVFSRPVHPPQSVTWFIPVEIK